MNPPHTLIDAAVAFLDSRARRGFVPVSSDNRVSAFALYASNRGHSWPCIDAATEFPFGSPFGWTARRLSPHIFTSAEIRRVVDEAAMLRPTTPLRPATFPTMFGLLAATSLRISEALALRLVDTDLSIGQLTVRVSKFGGSRLVPLHSTTVQALERYIARRKRHADNSAGTCLFTCYPDGRAVL
jgi:integrase